MFESFDRTHYILNVANAVAEWMLANRAIQGSCLWEQMVEIRERARAEYSARVAASAKDIRQSTSQAAQG